MATTVWQNLTDSLNNQMSIEEMSKKYLNTYIVIYPKGGQPLLACYKGHEDGLFNFTDEFGMKLLLRMDTDIEIANQFPERRLFNYGGVSYEFVRLPYRQYKRGICKENMQIYSPVRWLYERRPVNWAAPMLKKALFPDYPENCEEAIAKLQSMEVASIALNDTFMLSQSFTNNSKTKRIFYLWFSNKVIGFWEKGTFHIKHSLFKQEVLDNLHIFKPYKLELP